jgi:hypothetical protein
MEMGVDIYLNSIFEPWFEAFKGSEAERKVQAEVRESGPDAYFDAYRSSGGYFRNAYNGSDVMAACGSSWDTVYKMCDAEHRLPVDRARELVAMIEARPLTREGYTRHLAHYGPGPFQEMIDDAVGRPPPSLGDFDLDACFAFVCERRSQLIAILNKSIALNEPLVIN